MNVWPWVFISMGVMAVVGILSVGAITYKPHRALNVKYAEAMVDRVVPEQIIQLAPTHPEIVKTERLDRHPFYLLIHAGVFAYAICIFSGAEPTSNVVALGPATRLTMATCFVIGASLIILGGAMGMRIGRTRRFMGHVHNHLTSAVLGDDVTLPYRVGSAGMFAVCVSMTIYAATSFQSTTGSLGGWMTLMCALACVVLLPMLYRRVLVFERNESTLIVAAMAELGLTGDDGQ